MKTAPLFAALAVSAVSIASVHAQPAAQAGADPIATLVGRLELERYKATIKGLTQFGDRRQGTSRNRAAVDWIEAQLKSYGCTPTERLTYQWQPAPPRQRITIGPNQAVGGGTLRGHRRSTRVNTDSLRQPDERL